MHIAIGGNIGSGKTTLTGLLAKHYNFTAQYETVDENPYINDFYDEMSRWAFNLQVYFLHNRFSQVAEIHRNGSKVIQDRTIYEDAYIFATNLHDMGLMSSRDYDNYMNLFTLMISFVKPPDLLIYLRASVPTLVKQIQKRGRAYESGIRLDYLQRLNERYEAWIEGYTLGSKLIIDVDNNDFLESPEALRRIIDKVEAQINGLF
jgi:deoxyadenosine/deoxycytidine kinase